MKQLLCLLCMCALCWGCTHPRGTPPPPLPNGDLHDRDVYHDYNRQRHDYDRHRYDYDRQRHDAAHTGKPKPPPPADRARPVPPNTPGYGKTPSRYW